MLFFCCSAAEEAGGHQQPRGGHVELLGAAVGARDPRGAFR